MSTFHLSAVNGEDPPAADLAAIEHEWPLSSEGAWRALALCAQTDPEVFFPEKGGASTREAKKVCGSCEVRAECLEHALEHDERFGIWGGMSVCERRRLRQSDADATGPNSAETDGGALGGDAA